MAKTYFKEYWTEKLGSEKLSNKALQDGVVETAAIAPGAGSFSGTAVSVAASTIAAYKKGTGTEVVLSKVSIGTGSGRQPMVTGITRPASKATWDNYALISVPRPKN
ncbi:MAG: hypothetical protein IPP11_11935 [Chitinophagaceae bacterium]|nr:hypothetical protein [Chitinophagaceae bacterium]